MPIVDGLTSTKMIRSFEKTHTVSQALSERAALNGRVPIIAVSASLVERERQTYIDAGFDAWILKPISFDRLQVLLSGIVEPSTREECLYKPGKWESGGWFDMARKDAQFEADTKPDASKEASNLENVAVSTKKTTQQTTGEKVAAVDGIDDGVELSQSTDEKLAEQEEQSQAAKGIHVSDKAFAKSASAPGALGLDAASGGSDESTPKIMPVMVTDEPTISETPEPIQSPPPAT
jgi:hypothetical protein